ncbi:MAG TPA: complex I NDUFA9 subunit family protein [Verrucomicrobiae bacterium]|nr:complex I NDUFA9 subunit family protein [Verrucomicrobiae bacterium]
MTGQPGESREIKTGMPASRGHYTTQMNVLITGASGFVGGEVLRELHREGHAIRALVRSPESAGARKPREMFNTELRAGDVLTPASLVTAFSGADAVIHLVGIISEIGARTYENIHTRGTENVVRAAKAAGVSRYVHMSALGTRPKAASRYHQSKWAAEEIVRASGLAWTIFRPSIIYGPGDQFVNLFARMSRFSPVLPVMGDGLGKMQPIAVSAVAQAFVRSLSTPAAIGQTFDLCGLEPVTFREILDAILRVAGRRRLKLRIPLPLARVQAAMLEMLFPLLLRQAPPLNRDQLLMLQEDNLGAPWRAQRLFDLELVPFEQGIGSYLRS